MDILVLGTAPVTPSESPAQTLTTGLQLTEGQLINALVQRNADSYVWLSVNGQTLAARSEIPLRTGQEVSLHVAEINAQRITLRAFGQTEAAALSLATGTDSNLEALLSSWGFEVNDVNLAIARSLLTFRHTVSRLDVHALRGLWQRLCATAQDGAASLMGEAGQTADNIRALAYLHTQQLPISEQTLGLARHWLESPPQLAGHLVDLTETLEEAISLLRTAADQSPAARDLARILEQLAPRLAQWLVPLGAPASEVAQRVATLLAAAGALPAPDAPDMPGAQMIATDTSSPTPAGSAAPSLAGEQQPTAPTVQTAEAPDDVGASMRPAADRSPAVHEPADNVGALTRPAADRSPAVREPADSVGALTRPVADRSPAVHEPADNAQQAHLPADQAAAHDVASRIFPRRMAAFLTAAAEIRETGLTTQGQPPDGPEPAEPRSWLRRLSAAVDGYLGQVGSDAQTIQSASEERISQALHRLQTHAQAIATDLASVQLANGSGAADLSGESALLFPIPITTPDGSSTAYLKVYRRAGQRNTDPNNLRLALLFDLPELGQLTFNLGILEQRLTGQILSSRARTFDLVKEELSGLRTGIGRLGYRVEELTCGPLLPKETAADSLPGDDLVPRVAINQVDMTA
jgi:hypothetical protein